MTEQYPFPCCRCGFCCISETCPIGRTYYGIKKHAPCPGLSFDGDMAACALANKPVPIGDGCCIKARAIKGGRAYDFASLPPHLKISVVSSIRTKRNRR